MSLLRPVGLFLSYRNTCARPVPRSSLLRPPPWVPNHRSPDGSSAIEITCMDVDSPPSLAVPCVRKNSNFPVSGSTRTKARLHPIHRTPRLSRKTEVTESLSRLFG